MPIRLTKSEKLRLATRLLCLAPCLLAFNLVRSLFYIWLFQLPVKEYLICSALNVVYGSLGPRELQYFNDSTRTTYIKWMNKMTSGKDAAMVAGRLRSDIEPLASDAALLWVGDKKKAKRVVFYMHGGGFIAPMTPGHLEMVWRSYVAAGIETGTEVAVAVLEYTLYPAASHPVQLCQAANGLAHLLSSGFRPEDIVIAGDSAGGCLTAQLLSHLVQPHPQAVKIHLSSPLSASVLISPWVSNDVTAKSFGENGAIDMISAKSVASAIEQVFGPNPANGVFALDMEDHCFDKFSIATSQMYVTAAADGNSRTPGSYFKTPSSNFRSGSTPFDLDKTPGVPQMDLYAAGGSSDDSVDVSLPLDEFLRRYTSEDNESFAKIMERVNRDKKEKYGYLTEGEKEQVKTLEMEKRDRITDGYGTSDQPPSTLEGWKYTAKNLLMYNPSDRGEAPLTDEERAERIKGLTKEINRSNTRFHGKVTDSRPKEEDTVAVLYTPVAGGTPVPVPLPDRAAERSRKYDLEDLRKTPNAFYVESAKKAENGYNFVRTPSPAPGVDESPFITWGEIEGTPLRLDPEDTPVAIGGSGDGPHFKIPGPPSRDVKAHSLSREAARKLRERSKMFQKPPLPSPVRGGSASPSGRTLSPAAQKFVRNAISKSSSSVDETLRASYRGASPGVGTPKSGRSLTRFARDGSLGSRSPSVREASNLPW